MDYKDYFDLREPPFHLTPDPAYFFPSDAHREALQTLLYSIRAGEGFAQITGDPGTGKTLLIRTILKELGEDISTALIFNPRLSPHELLRALLEDLGLGAALIENLPREALLRQFRDFLLNKARNGQRVIVIIDEAQNLPMETLEELRLLSNLETEKEKLLQIILVGQRELEEKLNAPEIRQLHQRITIRYRLQQLSRDELHAYILHRLKIATDESRPIAVNFKAKALAKIYKASQGNPRLINTICERSLMAAYVDGRKTIQPDDVQRALTSIYGNEATHPKTSILLRPFGITAAVLLFAACAGLLVSWLYQSDSFRGIRPSVVREASREAGTEASTEQSTPVSTTRKHVVTAPVTAQPDSARMENLTDTVIAISGKPSETEPFEQAARGALFVGPEAYFVRIFVDTGKVQIWQGTENEPELTATLNHPWSYGQGLFMTGHDPFQGTYVFNHAAFLQGKPSMLSSPFWNRIETHLQGNTAPVIATSGDGAVPSEYLAIASGSMQTFDRFIHYWENRQIDELIELHGNIITNHSLDQTEPLVLARDHTYQRKRAVFNRSGFIDVNVSRPVFLLDPINPESVMIVYHQIYRSRIWQDEGTKVLYLSLQDSGSEKIWKVTAELWVADWPE